jgi:2-methylcitrate dehydratase PrpD
LLGAGRAAAERFKGWLAEKPGHPEPVVDLAQAELERLPMAFAAQVNLVTRGDLQYSARVDIPRGAAGRDPAETTGLVRRKFREQASRFLPDRQVEHALELVDHLEVLDNVADLAHTLCVP